MKPISPAFNAHHSRHRSGQQEALRRADSGRRRAADGFKGLETVRTDWTPLAQQFQQTLYLRVFRNEPYQDYVRETIASLMAGELDAQLVYRKRLRRPLAEYQRNVPPHVRAARLADEETSAVAARRNIKTGEPLNTSGPLAARNPWIISILLWITNTI